MMGARKNDSYVTPNGMNARLYFVNIIITPERDGEQTFHKVIKECAKFESSRAFLLESSKEANEFWMHVRTFVPKLLPPTNRRAPHSIVTRAQLPCITVHQQPTISLFFHPSSPL